MLQLPSQQKARAAKTPRGGRSTPRHVSSGARPAEAPRRVCFSPCTPDVLGHSRAPAAALAPPRRAIDAQEGTPQTVPPMARNAADKTSTTQSALKVNLSQRTNLLCLYQCYASKELICCSGTSAGAQQQALTHTADKTEASSSL